MPDRPYRHEKSMTRKQRDQLIPFEVLEQEIELCAKRAAECRAAHVRLPATTEEGEPVTGRAGNILLETERYWTSWVASAPSTSGWPRRVSRNPVPATSYPSVFVNNLQGVNTMSRRHTQAQNRKANKFGLKPFVPLLPTATRIYVDQMVQHVQGQVAIVGDIIDPAHIIDVDVIVAGTERLIDDLKSAKPKNWPWNKKLRCCGQIEKNCECGSGRIYA